jgi:co-chaperonin GroES (HSP10)
MAALILPTFGGGIFCANPTTHKVLMTVTNLAPASVEEKASSQTLPLPTGYHILIALLEAKEKTQGGILLPEEHIYREQTASIVGYVVRVGSDAYKDPKKFPNGPWCKEGDFILFNPYSGSRVKVHGKEFRLINDDTVLAVVDDPRGIERA